MNNNFNSLNNLQSPGALSSSVGNLYETPTQETTLNGHTFADLTNASHLNEASEKTITSYESFQKLPQLDSDQIPELYGKNEEETESASTSEETSSDKEEFFDAEEAFKENDSDFFKENVLDFDSEINAIEEIENHSVDQEEASVERIKEKIEIKGETNAEIKQQINNLLAQRQFILSDNQFLEHELGILQQDPENPLSPEMLSDFVNRLIDKAASEGKLFKLGSNGERIALTSQEIKELKQELHLALTSHFNLTLSSPPATSTEKIDKYTPKYIEIADREGHAVTVMRSRPESAQDKFVGTALELALLAKLMMSRIISEYTWEKKIEEEREKKILDLIDIIKQAVLKREILNQEISHQEINVQEIKGKLNKFIETPLDEMVKIHNVYNKFSNGKTVRGSSVRLQLPGLHKMKSMAAAAA